MLDDIRIKVKVKHRPLEAVRELRPNQPEGRARRRKKVHGPGERTVRVNSLAGGTELVVEGSFSNMLQGHNIIGTMNLQALVEAVTSRVFKHFRIRPTPAEWKRIKVGRVKLERLDVVGYLRVDHLGGVAAVIKALDVGLAGSARNRMIYAKQTFIYNVSGQWSLMAYDKAALMRTKKNRANWKGLDPRVKDIARKYLRVELRMFRKELERLGWEEVRDVQVDDLKRLFAKRLAEMIGTLQRPLARLLPTAAKLTKPFLLVLLLGEGIDLISPMPTSSRNRVWADLKRTFEIGKQEVPNLTREYRRTVAHLTRRPSFPIRHGAPRKLRDAGLVTVA